MKIIEIVVICALSSIIWGFQDTDSIENSVIEKTNELYDNKEYEAAIKIVNEGIEEIGYTDRLVNTKYKLLLASKDYKQALEVFEMIIKRVGNSPDVMIDKIRLLIQLERLDEALNTASTVDRESQERSPYISLAIAKIWMLKREDERALEWLEYSSERGFDDYSYLNSEEFKSLHGSQRFKLLIDQMKKKAGIGLPAKDFSTALFSGETYRLSADRGKVVLLDFWATWCPPCVAEQPNLKDIYRDFKDRGFEIVGICADSNKKVLERFLGRHSIPWINGFSGSGREDPVITLYRVDSFPKYIIVDRKGIVRWISSDGGEELRNLLAEILAEKS